MKKTFKITFEVVADYPFLNKEYKYLSKDFDNWIKSVAMNQDTLIPVLYKRTAADDNKMVDGTGSIEHSANANVHVIVEREGEVILDDVWTTTAPED